MNVGESLHVLGKEGAERAKAWLERTGRVDVNFSRYEVGETPFLTFRKPSGTFSFDIGGILRLDGGVAQFFGEVKKVSSEAGQGTQYREYLAKCYLAQTTHDRPYHFMWITWHPFNVGMWPNLCKVSAVRAAVEEYKDSLCADASIDETACEELAKRLWLIVLSDRQETLAMSDEMLGTLRKALVEGVTP
jgi:hypothetical protein